MENKQDITPQEQRGMDNPGGEGQVHKEQFNELSELSLEARMNVADQIGVPVNNLGDAAATGTMQDRDNSEGRLNERSDEDHVQPMPNE